jgi:hypothetical protein
MTVSVGTGTDARPDDGSLHSVMCGGRSVADMAAALQVRDAHVRHVRRPILEVQLSRLLSRAHEGGASGADAAVRAERLIARLERDDLDW